LIEAQIKEGDNGDDFRNENEIVNLQNIYWKTMKEMEHFLFYFFQFCDVTNIVCYHISAYNYRQEWHT
jgi:hypothetical protein